MKFISLKTKRRKFRSGSPKLKSSRREELSNVKHIHQFNDTLDEYFDRKVPKTYEIYQQAEKRHTEEAKSMKDDLFEEDCIPLDQSELEIQNYVKMPAIDGKKYIPQPFRHKYEMCIWKIGVHNTTKVKQLYFTPKNIIDNPNGVYHVMLEKTFDKGMIMLTSHLNSSTTMLVQTLDSKTFELLNEHEVVVMSKEVHSQKSKAFNQLLVLK